MNGSMETVLECVLPYIHDRDDRNSISLVSRKFYELDCITRNHLTVHLHYSPKPSRVSQRFPFIEFLTLKGLPDWDFPQILDIDITPWIKEISVKFECLKALRIRGLVVRDEDLKLLAKTRGKDLRSLKICKCEGFSTDGLMYVSNYCNDLRTLCLEDNFIEDEDDGNWLHELALHNKLQELNLICNEITYCQCFLIGRCPNLEVLCTNDACKDRGLRFIGQSCKNLRKLTHYEPVTHIGLIALVQGCTNLVYLDVKLLNISNEAFECIGSHLKNLCDIRINLIEKWCVTKTNLPLDNGIQAMLVGCIKLKRLALSLCERGLTDVGLSYIGKYGHNLRYLFLSCTGESDAGLLELSKGCPKLRKLNLENCPFSEHVVATFVFNIHTLRYIKVKRGYDSFLALTRPTFTAEVLLELKPYVTLAKKLRRLAAQLVADGSVVGFVKITYTSLRAMDDLDTRLVDAMVARCIYINKERVHLDRASEKPLEIIKVQIANVEPRLAVAISESGEIKVEGRVKDGVPHLPKIGALDVNVSLGGNIILCRQADQPKIIRSVSRILDNDDVNICSMSFSRIAQTKQAVMVIGVLALINHSCKLV